MSTLLWYEEADLVPYLPQLEAVGVRHLELRRLMPHVDPSKPASVDRLEAALAAHGLRLHSLHMPRELIIAMSSFDDAVRRSAVLEARAVMETLKRLGGELLVTHAGGAPVESPTHRARLFEISRGSIQGLADCADELGVRLAVENTLPTTPCVGDRVLELVRLVEGIGADHVGYCLDTSHANIGEDVVAAVRLVGRRLFALHVSDNDGKTDLHALPFTGTINWPAFMAALHETGYAGLLTFEVRGGIAPVKTLEAAEACFRRLVCSSRLAPSRHPVPGG